MAGFSDKFNDQRWRRKRDEILRRADYTCEYCGDSGPDVQVHICYHLKEKELWELPDIAYKCYCPSDRQLRQNAEIDLRIKLADFTINELDSIIEAMKLLAEIPTEHRSACTERLYLAAKHQRYSYDATR